MKKNRVLVLVFSVVIAVSVAASPREKDLNPVERLIIDPVAKVIRDVKRRIVHILDEVSVPPPAPCPNGGTC